MSEPTPAVAAGKPKLIALAEDALVPWCCAAAVLEGPKADSKHRAACSWNEERDQVKAGQPVKVHASEVIVPSRWIGGPSRD